MMRPATVSAGRRLATTVILLLLSGGAVLGQKPKIAAAPAKKEAPEKEAPKKDEKKDTKPKGPVTAIFARRAITVSGAAIDDAVILVADGKIHAIGAREDIEVPAFAKRVDAGDQVVMPGWVHPSSLAYTGGRSFSWSGSANRANRDVTRSMDPRYSTAKTIAKSGYTTLAVGASGGGFAGTGVLVRPVEFHDDGRLLSVDEVVRERESLLSMGFTPSTATKKALTETLERARKYIKDLAAWEEAEKKKAAEEAKKKAASKGKAKSDGKKPATKADPKKTDSKKPDPKKPDAKADPKKADPKKAAAKPKGPQKPKDDPRLRPIVKLVKKELPVVCGVSSASGVLHLHRLIKEMKDFRPALMMKPGSGGGFSFFGRRGGSSDMHAWRVLDEIKELGVPMILPPDLGVKPSTRTLRIVQRLVVDAGIPLMLVPRNEASSGYDSFRFDLLQLIRHGMSEDQVIRAVTLSPAEFLGVQERYGSLEKGKVADLLFFSGEPFAPTTSLERVMVDGKTIYEKEEADS